MSEESLKDIQQESAEFVDLNNFYESDNEELEKRDLETLCSLEGGFIINGVEFPPPTTCFLSFLELIDSPFITGKNIPNASDVINVLYMLKHREKAVRAVMWLKIEKLAKGSPEHFEKYIQNSKNVLTLSPYAEEIYKFGDELGIFDYDEASVIISEYVDISLGAFETIPKSEEEHKKKESSTALG